MQHISPDSLLPIKQLVQRYPNIGSEAAVRYQVFRAESNRLAEYGAIVKVGRKVFIDVDRYMAWMLSHRTS